MFTGITEPMHHQNPDISPKISIDWGSMLVIAKFTFESLQHYHEFEQIKHTAEFQGKMCE